MRVVMISKTFVMDAAQRQLEWVARQPGVDLTLITPAQWRMDDGRTWLFVPRFTSGYTVRQATVAFNGNYHLYYYRGLRRMVRELRPDILHIDEEPYNPAGYHAQRIADRLRIPTIVVAWQSQFRRFPPPWSWMERHDLRHAAHVISGNADVESVIRRKGYRGASSIFSVHGVDPEVFQPPERGLRAADEVVVGYLGRLLFDKGLGVLIEAITQLPERYRVRLVGSGPDREALVALAQKWGVADRVEILPAVSPADVPDTMASFDVFVLASLTRPNWKEQFGRVLVEAMACGVPVIGSDSGEIPRVVGDAGLITPEGDPLALAAAIRQLGDHPETRALYARRGRAHVLANHTQEQIARRLVALYQQVLAERDARQRVGRKLPVAGEGGAR